MKPEFVDNRNGNTLKEALAGHLEFRIVSGQVPAEVCIATAYFNPAGFAQIASHLEQVPKVRLLLGAEPGPEAGLARRRPMDPPEPEFSRRRLALGLRQLDLGLRTERDQMAFSVANSRALQSLVAFLRSGRIEVRRFERQFLHAKAYIFAGGPAGFIAGSSNFTFAGLVRNLELNLGRYEDPVVARAQGWFEDLWREGTPYDLADLYEEMFHLWQPYEVYLRVLWEIYGAEVEEAAEQEGVIPLTSFQRHGMFRARKILERYGGVIVADEVGLGKTFIAGDLMRLYCERRQRVLLVCPAALRDSTWKKFIHDYHLYIESVSYEELASDRQFMDVRAAANQAKLKSKLDEYSLVVVDEAHNYRNPDTPARAAVLRRLLFGPRKDLVLLTATPVNNSLWDLFTLIHYFIRQDSALSEHGVLSIRARFEDAMRVDPTSLNPDLLYPIIDATTVKRTRAFINKHYAGEKIRGPEGQLVPIVFPDPKPITVRYDLERALPGFFDHIADALDDEHGANPLEFARYRIEEYRKGPREDEKVRIGHAVVGLLRSGLLKRFESSAHAFAETVSRMVAHHELFLQALDAGRIVTTQFLREVSGDDELPFEEALETSEHVYDAAEFDVKRLRRRVQEDLDILKKLATEARKVQPVRDPKLAALVEELRKIARQARAEATDGIDRIEKRKVLIFSFFADTVRWIYQYLGAAVPQIPELEEYRGRIAIVEGTTGGDDISRERAVFGFAPKSSGAGPGQDADLFDILVTTDVLAEGVNLQQCRNIINYDLPWNPMRLVQRHGRVDRIGSPHARVFLRTIFPHDRLDAMLDLESRILDKLAQAAASIGVGTPPIDGVHASGHVFAETREEIEKLLKEDPTLFERGGTAAAAQTGEEYRQELRKALQRDRERIVGMPWKAGAGMRKGNDRGVFFCARVDARIYLRFVRATPEWAPAAPAQIVSEIGTCLRMIECSQDTPSHMPQPLQTTVFDFWDVARGDVFRSWERETDPASTQPKVRPLNRRVAQFIRDNTPQDADQAVLTRALDILETPWPRREETMLRDLFERADLATASKSMAIIEFVLKTGLEPFIAPEPLPPIEEEDVQLIAWIALEHEA